MLNVEQQLESMVSAKLEGSIVHTSGLTAAVADFPAPVGAVVEIARHAGDPLPAEVIGFRDKHTIVSPLQGTTGVRRGDRVRLLYTQRRLGLSNAMLGRVLDAQGHSADGRSLPLATDRIALVHDTPSAIERPPIDTPLATGVRAIDGLLTCGRGQRMGIFSGSGVGKSVLMGMMARYTAADVNVVALIGERGREINEFIERDLGPEGLAKTVLVVATSDEPALMRVQAAFTATAIAEYFRDQGKDVLLLMDSLTRFAMAQREIGLASGEPPTTRGYPPSVFSLLPKLVERAGRTATGSITAFYSVLVEGDDPNEPISDAVRGLLDGHTWLSRDLASRGHFPAIDLLQSLSRLMPSVASEQQQEAAIAIRRLLAAYRDHEDLISIGAYRAGSNPTVDQAIAMRDLINVYLQQQVGEASIMDQAVGALIAIHGRMNGEDTPPSENTPRATNVAAVGI